MAMDYSSWLTRWLLSSARAIGYRRSRGMLWTLCFQIGNLRESCRNDSPSSSYRIGVSSTSTSISPWSTPCCSTSSCPYQLHLWNNSHKASGDNPCNLPPHLLSHNANLIPKHHSNHSQRRHHHLHPRIKRGRWVVGDPLGGKHDERMGPIGVHRNKGHHPLSALVGVGGTKKPSGGRTTRPNVSKGSGSCRSR